MNIKKILYLLIFGLILFGINNSCFAAASDSSYYGRINLRGSIFKTNDHGDALLGAKFRIYDVNNTFSYYLEDENNGLYGFGYSDGGIPSIEQKSDTKGTFDTILNSLPGDVKEDVEEYLDTKSTSHLNTNFYTIDGSNISFTSILFVEEVTAPKGYARGEKIIIPVRVYASSRIFYSLEMETIINSMYLKYNKNVDYSNLVSYAMGGNSQNDFVDCERLNFNSNALTNTGIDYVPIILFNEKSNVSLSIKNYVNDLESYTTTRGKKLNYKIVIENSGSEASHNNIIVTKIPKELEFVSASDGGEYNKTNHTITWGVSEIGANQKISLRYSAYVPKTISGGIDFIGSSSINSDEVGLIQSRETKVSLITNPKTEVPIAIIVLLASMIGVVTVVKNHNKEKELEI